ncbi:MAG: prolipoprotein diacylglyceryl transferase [Bacteroidota bacterium]|jgi:phosphatidylglycerol:prolipoprotein diacylglycerol transferase
MYPTLSDLIRDLFGLNIPLPIQTFGFFMALSFAAAYIATQAELKRKENNGLLKPQRKKVIQNKPLTSTDFAVSIMLGALVGYKLLDMVLHYADLVNNPQAFILSSRGHLAGAFLGAAFGWYTKYDEQKKLKDKKPQEIEINEYPHELMGNILAIAAITGLMGAKIFHNLEYIGDFIQNPIEALLSFSGLTFYGGLIIAAFSVVYYTHKNGIPTLHMIDAAAPGLMLAYGIGRIGCHLSGDGDWGIVNVAANPIVFLPDWFWSYNYPNNVVNEGLPMPDCIGKHCSVLPQPVYPTPLYEAIAGIALFLLLWQLRKHITTAGVLFCIYLMVNGAERFLIEKIRVNSTYEIFGAHITQAELISSLFLIIGSLGIWWLNKRNKSY